MPECEDLVLKIKNVMCFTNPYKFHQYMYKYNASYNLDWRKFGYWNCFPVISAPFCFA